MTFNLYLNNLKEACYVTWSSSALGYATAQKSKAHQQVHLLMGQKYKMKDLKCPSKSMEASETLQLIPSNWSKKTNVKDSLVITAKGETNKLL